MTQHFPLPHRAICTSVTWRTSSPCRALLIPLLTLAVLASPPAVAQEAGQADAAPVGQEKPRMSRDASAEHDPPQGGAGLFLTTSSTGAWRFKQLQGHAVETPGGERLGEITDIIVSQDGQLDAIIISVSGLIGLGTKTVAVTRQAFGAALARPVNSAVSTSNDDASSNEGAGHTGGDQADIGRNGTNGASNATGTARTAVAPVGRIILRLTRADLEAAPAFEP